MLKRAHSEINIIYSLYVGMQRSNDMMNTFERVQNDWLNSW